LPEPDGKPTDAVSVVGKASLAPSASWARRRGALVAAALASVAMVTVVVVALESGPPGHVAAVASTGAPSAAVVPIATVAAPVVRPPLRVHASAPLAWLRVDGKGVPVAPGAVDVPVDLSAVAAGIAVTIEAGSVDGRRASLMIAAEAPAVTVEFAPLPLSPGRAAPAPRSPSHAAPLAPSPYP
jgi:hypothetical protein